MFSTGITYAADNLAGSIPSGTIYSDAAPQNWSDVENRHHRNEVVDHRNRSKTVDHREANIRDHRKRKSNTPRRNETVTSRRGRFPAPSDVTLSGVHRRSLSLHWMDNATVEYGVSVERCTPTEVRGGINYHWKHVFNVEERVDSRMRGTGWRTDGDDGLNPGTEYCYRLRAYRNKTFSAYSEPVCTHTS